MTDEHEDALVGVMHLRFANVVDRALVKDQPLEIAVKSLNLMRTVQLLLDLRRGRDAWETALDARGYSRLLAVYC